MSEKEGWKLFRRAKDMCNQSRESEAEVLFRQALAIYEKALGKNHAKTISVKITLGRFFEQMKRWSEAEEQYQELVDERERTLGVNHTDTLESKCQLGHTLYYQEKYSEAEIQYYQVVDRGEKFFSKNHKVMVDARYALAGALYRQKNYEEAIVQFQQVVDGREEAYGENHKRTLNSKQWLRHAINKQKTSNEGVVRLQQAADSQRKALGGDHADSLSALNSSHQLKAELNRTLSAPSQNAASPNPTNRLDGFFPRDQYTDSDVSEISSLLGHINPQWSKVPRTYIVLRAIGQMPLLQSIIDVGFSDFWFPVTEQSLPGFMSLSARSAFVDAQTIVLTKSINLEKAENGHHCHFKDGESLPFESRGIIGHGGSSQVDKVLSTITFREYARKIVHRSEAFRGKRKEDVRRFIAEIQVLKRLKHYHVVEYVGSYTDAKFIGLIMSPVAEMDLNAYLAHCDVSKHIELRTFFGCLATALEFLHHKKVRHKDIKPQNILVHQGKVLFADFGLSFDFTDANGSTTTGMASKTPRYCAPEVAEYDPRNTSSDIWSLGVVFLEMAAALKGKKVKDIDEFFTNHGSHHPYIRSNLPGLAEFIATLEGMGQPSDNIVFSWTKQMLVAEPSLRLTASSLVTCIVESENQAFCGICCKFPDEEMSDWSME